LAENTLGVGINKRPASVAASSGEGGASVMRKLGITPVIVDCTDALTDSGTHRKCVIESSPATTSAISSVEV
jgi:hypothetical protein